MKKSVLALMVIGGICGQASAQSWLLTDTESNTEKGDWQITSQQLKLAGTDFSIQQKVLHGGKQEGSKVLTITSSPGLTIALSPGRGMDLLYAKGDGIRLGWDSPVGEVVNPAYINLESRNGLGWLEGFNEMMVRCGYEWTGHPVTQDGMLYTLHGKAGNTPASKVEVIVDDKAPHEIRIRGLLKEHTFKKARLDTQTELRYIPGSDHFTIHDVLTNNADYPHDYEIIYHSNFGQPILEKNARFIAPLKSVSPFNDYAKKGMADWDQYAAPTRDFDEMVFNLVPKADDNGKTLAALINSKGDKGVSIEFDTRQLPLLTMWKNTDTLKQGYVTGIEPGTNYAYPVTIEKQQGRVKQLAAGESTDFTLTYSLLKDAKAVQQTEKRVKQIQGNDKIIVSDTPIAQE
ncbi:MULTISPECIES: aldose 1-epimerase family protein [unclassified Tatumella]|uniref:aldose 1-epimerase family protein n=1 Tax=unclassified Tatumella TaxID=2649542 RepID=UPI001BAF6426|nr:MULTISPECIES: aldose 1-epimerase family protein [unclassified Tatumella]MBS0854927.1 aldose 1-epimerase family protein [Tatumella sp. JGM16]MBS0876386.1 aldose 1-epimerase family protein [Tatumella sp. JGM82]MBS0889559.1 aldose 1-epimerase family protein [Tatumella sp. JGM94]MBS0900681.1 aldose 1-epimerase family protein [Tatumella sp. JGM100]MBS0912111.1 aldose 1-epimerase family protein [Tatumella sp. JGM91]